MVLVKDQINLLFLRAVGPGTLSFNLFLRKGPSGVKFKRCTISDEE